MTFEELRQRSGLTQQQIADQAGLTRAMISRYANGKARPRYDNARILCRILDCDIDVLYEAIALSRKKEAREA